MTTVIDFTDDVSEIRLGSVGPYVLALKNLLEKTGIESDLIESITDSYEYDIELEKAVMSFQKEYGLAETGIVNDTTLNAIINVANNLSDIVYSEAIDDADTDIDISNNPHFNSFFSKDNIKDTRVNNQDIIIRLGESNIVKTIHNVYMRGVNTEFDTSGNPISEIYEFIAQDIKESDELSDLFKYE